MGQEFGMKELYFAQLKTTSNIEIDGNYLAPGEVIASFDKIQISHFKEIEQYIAATGGYENRERVIWRRPKELDLVFTQGIFNKTQFALMTNARLGKLTNEMLGIGQRDIVETDENGNTIYYGLDPFTVILKPQYDEECSNVGEHKCELFGGKYYGPAGEVLSGSDEWNERGD